MGGRHSPQPSTATAPTLAPVPAVEPVQPPAPSEDEAPKTTAKKPRRRFPTTPEREAAEKPVRRSKRLSDEHPPAEKQPSPHKRSHAASHANTERSPSPDKARPLTVEKKRRKGANGVDEEEKTMRIQLPFQDTPIIRRNKEMRKTSGDGSRRSSGGLRGHRASSLIDEGRGNGMYFTLHAFPDLTPLLAEASESSTVLVRFNTFKQLSTTVFGSPTPPPSDEVSPTTQQDLQAYKFAGEALADKFLVGTAMPHAEVNAAEFFKHISADLTEPRRMRCLLGWCGTRALPPKPEAPKESTAAATAEFQAQQAGMIPFYTDSGEKWPLTSLQLASFKKSSH